MWQRIWKWIWDRLPCDHEFVYVPRNGASRHQMRCRKCNKRGSCRCGPCRQPWRDW